MRVENKSAPYIHTHRTEIEQFMNQIEWAENTLQEAEEHPRRRPYQLQYYKPLCHNKNRTKRIIENK